MQNSYKIVSLLLDYPDEEVKNNLHRFLEIVDEDNLLDDDQKAELTTFINYASPLTLNEWQMQYVQLFDFSTKTNLYLFDHVYGDSRERGQAMIDLTEMYVKSGFVPCSNELPDYLPLFLEYLSLLTNEEEARQLLQRIAPIVENMKQSLEKRESPYGNLLQILCSLNEKKGGCACPHPII